MTSYEASTVFLIAFFVIAIQMGFWGAAHKCVCGGRGQKSPFPKICHTYPTMMKLGTVIPFHRKLANFVKSRNTDID